MWSRIVALVDTMLVAADLVVLMSLHEEVSSLRRVELFVILMVGIIENLLIIVIVVGFKEVMTDVIALVFIEVILVDFYWVLRKC